MLAHRKGFKKIATGLLVIIITDTASPSSSLNFLFYQNVLILFSDALRSALHLQVWIGRRNICL